MSDDIDTPIYGVDAIARATGRTKSQTYYALEKGHLPASKLERSGFRHHADPRLPERRGEAGGGRLIHDLHKSGGAREPGNPIGWLARSISKLSNPLEKGNGPLPLHYCAMSDGGRHGMAQAAFAGKRSQAGGGRHERPITSQGACGELEVLHLGQEAGFAVTKRSAMYRIGHDLDWPLLGVDRRIEVERHAAGQGRLYAWLGPVYAVIHRGDRREWLVTLRLRDAIKIAKAAEGNK
jgi:hypothetical protein